MANLNLIGVEVDGIIMEAGGNNSGMLNLLWHKKSLGNTVWPDTNFNKFNDPTISKNRQVAMCLCMTHGMKNVHNAFLASQGKGIRNFINSDQTKFG